MTTSGLETLHLENVSRPSAMADQALVQIKAAGLNPSDLANVLGKFKQTTLPRTPGRDYAGVVVEGPAEWVDAEVWGSGAELGFTVDGTHAEYLLVPAASLVRKPNALSFNQAAAAGVPLATAWQAVVDAGQVRSGETVLVTGAAGAVGTMACQIARHFGARPIGVARGITQTPLGVPCADSEQPDLIGQIRALAGPSGVQFALDTVGGELFHATLASLAEGGRLSVIITQGDGQITFDLRDFYHRRLRLLGVDSLKLDTIATAEIYRAAGAAIEAGSLTIPQPQPITLPDAVEAYRGLSQKRKGKFILVP